MNEPENFKIEKLGQQLDDILEDYDLLHADMVSKAIGFLKSQEDPVAVFYASLLSERIFNCDFILNLKFDDASWLVTKILPTVDPYTRTQFIWQVLQCSTFVWMTRSKFIGNEPTKFKDLCRAFLTHEDMIRHPYSGSIANWLQPFDSIFFETDTVRTASHGIKDECFVDFDRFVKSSLWLNRIYQADFFAVSSIVKQLHMHKNLEKVPLLPMLKFVSQILHSGLDPNIKLAFWKKVNNLDGFEDARTLSSNDAVKWLVRKCSKCRPLFESMFQFPQLYDKLYEMKFDDWSASHWNVSHGWKGSNGFGTNDDSSEKISAAKRFITEYDSFEEVAIQLMLIGEEIKHDDLEYMLYKKKFSMVGECVKNNLEFALDVLPVSELMFLVLKYVKNDLCLECLESFERYKPGIIGSMRDYYDNNALWYLAHRKMVKHPSEAKKHGRKITKARCAFNDIYDALTKKYGCDPDSKNVYGMSYNTLSAMSDV